MSFFPYKPKPQELDLSLNMVHGPLPLGLRRLTRLERLNLSDNVFEGSVPDEVISALPRLQRLSLYMVS